MDKNVESALKDLKFRLPSEGIVCIYYRLCFDVKKKSASHIIDASTTLL